MASSLALSRAINFNSIMVFAIHISLENFHDTTVSPIIKTYPLMDFEYLKSDIQIVLLYPSSTIR